MGASITRIGLGEVYSGFGLWSLGFRGIRLSLSSVYSGMFSQVLIVSHTSILGS